MGWSRVHGGSAVREGNAPDFLTCVNNVQDPPGAAAGNGVSLRTCSKPTTKMTSSYLVQMHVTIITYQLKIVRYWLFYLTVCIEQFTTRFRPILAGPPAYTHEMHDNSLSSPAQYALSVS